MPLQRHDTRPVPRPSGLIPPAAAPSGVTELRLHGVGGTTPENLLADAAPLLVSGDRVAGFYRTADIPAAPTDAVPAVPAASTGAVPAAPTGAVQGHPPGTARGRHVEAYSWGGLTSRSAS